jgi:hypothetical protein
MYFPTSGAEVDPWVPPLVALGISFFTSMGGVSGAVLLLPFQMSFLGSTNPSVSATNHLFNVVAIPSGVYAYIREGRMAWLLALAVVMGTIPGAFVGALVRVVCLPDPKHFKLFAALVLLYVGLRLAGGVVPKRRPESAGDQNVFRRIVRRRDDDTDTPALGSPGSPVFGKGEFSFRRMGRTFHGRLFGAPVWGIVGLGFAVGIIGGIYGIGGGAIIAPFLVTVFRLPVRKVAGAALAGTFVTSLVAVFFYRAIAHFHPDLNVAPDWGLGLLFGVGGMVGMYLGARCQKYVPVSVIKLVLCGAVLFASLRYGFEFFR